MIKKRIVVWSIAVSLALSASFVWADEMSGQSLQINTYFHSIIGKPSWLLIVRDMQSQKVTPYLFDLRNDESFLMALTYGHAYRVTVSTLTFGPCAIIHNFCGLENGVITGQSLFITLKGNLTPDPGSSKCHVEKYASMDFPIVTTNQ